MLRVEKTCDPGLLIILQRIGPCHGCEQHAHNGKSRQKLQSQTGEDRERAGAADRFARQLTEDASGQQRGSLVINPLAYPRRIHLQLNHPIAPPAAGKALYAFENHEDGATVIVDVPSAGFAWLPNSETSAGRPLRHEKHLVDELTLRNEFLQLTMDRETGGIRAIRDYQSRGNCLSQQIAGHAVADHGNYISLFTLQVSSNGHAKR